MLATALNPVELPASSTDPRKALKEYKVGRRTLFPPLAYPLESIAAWFYSVKEHTAIIAICHKGDYNILFR
jgi:hypothetical protein